MQDGGEDVRAAACAGSDIGAGPHSPALRGHLRLESSAGEVLFVQQCKHCGALYVQHKGLKAPKPRCDGTGNLCAKGDCEKHAGQPCPVCPGCVDCT